MVGAGVEYKYFFRPEGLWHIWKAVDMRSWHLCWDSYLRCFQEGTAGQSYQREGMLSLNRGRSPRALWVSSLRLSQSPIWQPVSCRSGPRLKKENSLASTLSSGCWRAVPQIPTPPKLTCSEPPLSPTVSSALAQLLPPACDNEFSSQWHLERNCSGSKARCLLITIKRAVS